MHRTRFVHDTGSVTSVSRYSLDKVVYQVLLWLIRKAEQIWVYIS